MKYTIKAVTGTGREAEFRDVPLSDLTITENSIKLVLKKKKGVFAVTVTPEHKEETIRRISHTITTPLRNFHNVICPDTGRDYFKVSQLVDFWTEKRTSLISNVRLPLFIFNGQDHNAVFSFGIIGRNYETSFQCLQPRNNRALLAYTGKLSLEITRGIQGNPIPDEYAAENQDKSITEYLFLRSMTENLAKPWISVLKDFSVLTNEIYGIERSEPEQGLEPYWCSWTDWLSDDVTEELMLSQVKQGVGMGIKNYILDDGWFGPGLDKDYEYDLNIGDWNGDPAKVRDVRQLSRTVRKLGGRLIAWCAPHAVGIGANCYQKRLPYLVKDSQHNLVLTKNRFNILCVQNPEAREIMTDICVKIAAEYETDGAKYDLFNCIPDTPCCAAHSHDTQSPLIALEKLLKMIWERTRQVNPDYIIELKQNYGGPFLCRYGTVMRAGDTPYNPEGNFIRTAYLQGYTPFAMNDYQTITNHDSLQDTAVMVIKMLAVGIPSYSMDLCTLTEDRRDIIAHYNKWYLKTIHKKRLFTRTPQDGGLNVWKISGRELDIFFLVNTAHSVTIDPDRRCFILNGAVNEQFFLHTPSDTTAELDAQYTGPQGDTQKRERFSAEISSCIRIERGGMVEITPVG